MLLGRDEKHNIDGDQSAPYKILNVWEMFRNTCTRFFLEAYIGGSEVSIKSLLLAEFQAGLYEDFNSK